MAVVSSNDVAVRRRHIARLLFPLTMLLAFIYSIIVVLRPVPPPVPEADWKAAEAVIAADEHAGNMIIVHPVWEDGALMHFRNAYVILGIPNTKKHESFPVIWLILAHGSEEPDYLGASHTRTDTDIEVGSLRLIKYLNPGLENVRYSFINHYMTAKVEIRKNGKTRACDTFRKNEWVCPIKNWNSFGFRNLLVDGVEEPVLWMHPIKGWATRATYKNVEMSTRLEGEFALKDSAATFARGTPVVFSVFIDERLLGTYKTNKTTGWQTFSIDTADLEGQAVNVTFQVESKEDKLRHFGFRARLTHAPVSRKGVAQ